MAATIRILAALLVVILLLREAEMRVGISSNLFLIITLFLLI